jgi:hypothetical protein
MICTFCVHKAYPDITNDDFAISDNGEGEFFSYWNEDKFGPAPSAAYLAEFEIEVAKDFKYAEMKESFYQELNNGLSGYMTKGITTNFRIDSSRSDLDNLKNLRDVCAKFSLPDTTLRGFHNDYHTVTVEELDTIILELQMYGLWLFQQKWNKEVEIRNATTKDQINNITFLGD